MVLAEESHKTKRAREKLKKQFADHERKSTKEAVEEKREEIHRWIARHASHREVLKQKTIALFDGNQNPAEMSQKIVAMAQKLEAELKDHSAKVVS